MKILSILSQKPSSTGSGVYMGELVKSFDKIGAKQAIICGQDLNQPNDYEFARHIEDLKVYSVDFNSEALPFDMFGMSDVMPYPSQRYQDMTPDQLKKYKEAFEKAENFEKEGKYKEAWSALPKVSEFPDFAETIRKKQDEYERHFAPSLFTENSSDNMAENQENY